MPSMKSSYAKFWWKVTIAICPSPERGSNRSWLNRSLVDGPRSPPPRRRWRRRGLLPSRSCRCPAGRESIRLNGGIGSALRLDGDVVSSALPGGDSAFVGLTSGDGPSAGSFAISQPLEQRERRSVLPGVAKGGDRRLSCARERHNGSIPRQLCPCLVQPNYVQPTIFCEPIPVLVQADYPDTAAPPATESDENNVPRFRFTKGSRFSVAGSGGVDAIVRRELIPSGPRRHRIRLC